MGKYDYRWGNDVDAGPSNPASDKYIKRAVYETLQRQGVKPEQLFDKKTAEAYAAWLADHDCHRAQGHS